MHHQPYRPKHGDFRIAKQPTPEGIFWIWCYQIDSSWLFVSSMSLAAAGDFTAKRQKAHEDSQYEYWR